MSSIENTAGLWKTQHPDPRFQQGIEKRMSGLAAELQRFEHRRWMLNLAKTIVAIAGILVSQSVVVLHRDTLSLPALLGSAIIVTATLFFLIGYWRNRSRIAELDRTDPAEQFLRKAIVSLSRQKIYFDRWFRWLAASLAIGLCLVQSAFQHNETVRDQVTLYALTAVLIFLLSAIGIRIRESIFASQDRPLIDRLRNALRDLQSEGQERGQ